MKERMAHFTQRVRRSNIENYFHQRRMQLLSFRERQSINEQSLNGQYTHRQYVSWRQMVLHGVRPSQQQSYSCLPGPAGSQQIEFEINVTSVEAGEYYLNFLIDGAPYNYLEETVHLLGKLVGKMLGITFKMLPRQEQLQLDIILRTLRQIHYYLMVGQDRLSNSTVPNFKNTNQTKRILVNLLDQEYRQLLQKQHAPLTTEVLNIAFELCSNYMVYPNHQVVRFIITKIVIRDNLNEGRGARESRDTIMEFNQKIEELIMKFVLFLRMEESTNRKNRNVHHLQVIYELHSFIEYNLVNIYEFVRHRPHALDYQHLNNDLYFNLNLFTQILLKFKNNKCLHYEHCSVLVLVKPGILDLIYNLTLEHSKVESVQRDTDEFILTIQETVFKIYQFVMEESSKQGPTQLRRFGPRQWEVSSSDRYILDMLTVLKLCLRQMEQQYPNTTK